MSRINPGWVNGPFPDPGASRLHPGYSLPIYEHGRVAIVMDGDKFLGLITRIDLLNYLRRRVA